LRHIYSTQLIDVLFDLLSDCIFILICLFYIFI